jgi:hypothetical protein
LLKEIIATYTPEEYDYEPTEGSRKAKKSDYDNVDVIPVSDPNAATMAQKIVQYQAALQLAQTSPQLYNMPLLHRQMLEVIGIKNVQKLIPMEEDLKPIDPVTENQNVLMMKPVKAFAYQDHTAHITVHMSAMQDPKIAQLLQGNPQAQQLQAAMMSHINEHLGFQYRIEIEKQLGMNLPPQKDESGEDKEMDPQVEARLAPMLAQASQQLLQQNQSEQAQQQAQQKAQDPIIQMQMQELQLKQQEAQRQAQKDAADIQLRQKQMDLDAMKTAAQIKATERNQKAERNLEALKAAAQIHHDKDEAERARMMDMFFKNLDLKEAKEDRVDEGMKHMATIEAQKESKQKEEKPKGKE